jgi:hypothetical protein
MRSYRVTGWFVLRLLCLVLLTYVTVQDQVIVMGPGYLEGGQLEHHKQVLAGTAGDPWQYRVFSEYLAEGLIRLAGLLGAAHPATIVFVALRVAQNLAIFVAAWLYFRRLGLPELAACLGVGCLAGGMMQGYYNSDLQLSTYFDLLYYLLAGLIILSGRRLWLIVPLTVLAAFTRETGGLIPVMLAAVGLTWDVSQRRPALIIAGVSLCLFGAVVLGLRQAYPPQSLLLRTVGYTPGSIDTLVFNLTRAITYVKVVGVMGVFPVIALYAYRTWPGVLRAFFWGVVPVWVTVHLLTMIAAEARSFLVPQALVFIPGALRAIRSD